MRTPRLLVVAVAATSSLMACSSSPEEVTGSSSAKQTTAKFCPNALVPRTDMARYLEKLKHGRDFQPPASRGQFVDISDDADRRWAEALFDDGITKGCDATHFCPGDSVPREQMAAFIVRLFHGPDFARAGSNRFADVTGGHEQFEGYIEQLADDGITKGCTATEFCPGDQVPREQMAAFLMRAAHRGSADTRGSGRYTDVPADNQFSGRIEQAVDEGIMEPCEDDEGPVEPAKRVWGTTWVTPDIKSTLHIKYFNTVSACLDVGCVNAAQTAIIEGLRQSANPEPPASFDDSSWQAWKASKEYRGFIHVRPVKFWCDGNGQITVGQPQVEINDGYTKEPYPGLTVYSPSDVYRGNAIALGTTIEPLDRGDCAIVWSTAASRVNEIPRRTAYAAFIQDAPFVYERVAERICCDGSVTVSVEHSHFPTSRLYVDNGIVDAHEQRDLGRFIYSGGWQFHDNGYGNIAGPSAAPMSWSGWARSADGS